jgi:hypothetical protein
VRVSGIAPGDHVARSRHGRTAAKEIVAKTLLKRSGPPEDVVPQPCFSEGCAVRHGQIPAVDGGGA